MKTGTKGTARNGQRGTVIAVYTNAVLFQSTTGARFTLLNAEFTPDSATPDERARIATKAAALFERIGPRDGFQFRIQRNINGRIASASIARVPPFGGDPKPEVAPPAVFSYAFERAAA